MDRIANHTALYTPLDIEYAQAMSGPYEDLSSEEVWYDVSDSHRVAGYAGQTVAALKAGRIDGFWRPMVCAGDEMYQRDEIVRLWEISSDITYMDFLVGGNLSPISRFLLERKYRVAPLYTQVIDLWASCADLRGDLRKSYRSLVNKDADVWPCSVADVRAVHLQARGVTRPDATWTIQGRMQTVCMADGDRAAVMFYHGDIWAYYACGAGANAHAAIWAALVELKKRGVHFVEMGEQLYSWNTLKLINIARFKAGFGGTTKARLILERGLACPSKD